MSEHPWIKRGPYPGPEHTGMPIPDDDDPIVGHSTFRDGHHEPLRKKEAESIMAAIERTAALRAEQMPDEQAAIKTLFDAWLRLKELGWKEAQYCPKDGSLFAAIENGSTGVHRCRYEGEWPDGHWWIVGDDDLYPSRPCLWRPLAAPSGATSGIASPAATAQKENSTSSPVLADEHETVEQAFQAYDAALYDVFAASAKRQGTLSPDVIRRLQPALHAAHQAIIAAVRAERDGPK